MYLTIWLYNYVQSDQTMPADSLSSTFHALSDPTRRAILAGLATGEKTVTDLAEPFDMSMPAVTKHLKVLEKAKLIERSRKAQYRPCRFHPEPLRDVDAWMKLYRKFWEASFDRLDDYLTELQTKEKKRKHGTAWKSIWRHCPSMSSRPGPGTIPRP